MAEEQGKLPEDKSGSNLIETTGRVRMRPVPLSFGGVKGDAGSSRRALPGAGEERSEYEVAENPRKIIRQGLLVVFLFFGILGVWAFFGTIQGAVVGSGRIKIDTERKIVQHLEGGIVDEILVREGQEVVQGEPLIVLQSVRTDADASMTRKELVSLEAQRLRAIAEKDGLPDLAWPKELSDLAAESGSDDVLANEEKIFKTRRDTLNTQLSLLENQIAQLQAQIGGNNDQLQSSIRIIATLQEELSSKRRLHKERYLDKTQILALERQLASEQGTRGRLRQQIAELRQRIAESNLRITETRGKFVEEATRNLGDLDNRVIQARERLRPLIDAATRLQIKAPVGGRVVDLKVHSKGSVIRPGETLMDIVPHDNPLIVETQVPINRITEVYIGQKAMVQLDAFDTRMLPHMPGKVTYISADALEPRPGFSDTPFYLCYVEVDPEALKEERLYLSPGMPATVFITTQERTIVYYMFEPYIKSWQRALRD
ncbi:MAG: HlyD family type I secretion periplasmic adaptor subunit [Desulfovibrio sp.]|nr:HlyD family type I secretion periplasmic adaptor subunit [Desulfovibrio sp.]